MSTDRPSTTTALSAFVESARASPETLAGLAERGVSGEWLTRVADVLHVSVVVRHWLGVQGTCRAIRFDPDNSVRVLELVKPIGRVQSIVAESVDLTNFGRQSLGGWLSEEPTSGAELAPAV